MSKILNLVKEHFNNGDSFNARDFENKTGVDYKVASMNLRKLSNAEKLGRFLVRDYSYYYYYLRSLEECNKAIVNNNENIDKYNLNQKKLKLLKSI